jgi:type IV pilus assembly protein PilN
MSPTYRLNLAERPFRPYRKVNLAMAVLLVALGAFAAWQFLEYRESSANLERLRAEQQTALAEWSALGERIGEYEIRLGQPDSEVAAEEVRFLNQILARKQFSWTTLLLDMEATMPRWVYLVSLAPGISGVGDVRLRMEARGRSVDDLSQFLADLEDSSAFSNVIVSIEERGMVEGRVETRMLIDVDYDAAAIPPVSVEAE